MHISDTVDALMKRAGIKGATALARALREFGAENVRTQHIQNLLRGDVEQPKYEHELARFFGLSVEDLRAGRIDKAQPNAVTNSQQLSRGAEDGRTSQSLGLDRSLLRHAVRLLRGFELSQDKLLPPEEFAERLADLYEVLPRADESAVEPEGSGT
jgi:hypothetical protein